MAKNNHKTVKSEGEKRRVRKMKGELQSPIYSGFVIDSVTNENIVSMPFTFQKTQVVCENCKQEKWHVQQSNGKSFLECMDCEGDQLRLEQKVEVDEN